MPDFSLKSRDEGDIVILETNGYLNNLGGEEVAKACYKRINEGKNDLIQLHYWLYKRHRYKLSSFEITGLDTKSESVATRFLHLCDDFPIQSPMGYTVWCRPSYIESSLNNLLAQIFPSLLT